MKPTMKGFARLWTIVRLTGLFLVLWGILLVAFVVPFAAKFEMTRQNHP
jgi:hypothetical protein